MKFITIKLHLACLGLFFFSLGTEKAYAFMSVCARHPEIQKALVNQLGIPCEKMTEKNLKKVKQLDLSFRDIDNLLPGNFDGLISLHYLNLRGNQLQRIHQNLFELPNLATLILDNNDIRLFEHQALSGMPNLSSLSISHNDLGIDSHFYVGYLLNLESLEASKNNLGVLPRGLEKLKKLRTLNLSGNNIDQIPKNYAGQFHELRHFNLESNGLKDFPEFIKHSPQLKGLYLNNNRIRAIPRDVTILENLEYFDIKGNPLVNIPQWLTEWVTEQELELFVETCKSLFNSLVENFKKKR